MALPPFRRKARAITLATGLPSDPYRRVEVQGWDYTSWVDDAVVIMFLHRSLWYPSMDEGGVYRARMNNTWNASDPATGFAITTHHNTRAACVGAAHDMLHRAGTAKYNERVLMAMATVSLDPPTLRIHRDQHGETHITEIPHEQQSNQ